MIVRLSAHGNDYDFPWPFFQEHLDNNFPLPSAPLLHINKTISFNLALHSLQLHVICSSGSCVDFPLPCVSQQHSVVTAYLYISLQAAFLPSAAAVILIVSGCVWLGSFRHEEGKRCVTLSVRSGALPGVNALCVSWQTQQPLHRLGGAQDVSSHL